nr:DUF4270 family protein [uncultured Carboxylicivirga sp.]
MSLITTLRKAIPVVVFALLTIAISSCDDGDLGVAKGFVRSNTYTALIDTVSINLSSIKADSVQTSGMNAGLVGYYNNPLIGGQKATCYFAITTPESFTWDNDKQIIDSIALIIKPSGYSIGDTTSTVSFKVHQLTEKIEKNNSSYLNNINHFDFNDETLGTKSMVLWPGEQKSIVIRLNNQFASNIVDFINENKNVSTYKTLFQDEFKGFAVQTDTLLTNAIYGINTTSDTCKLRLYSHLTNLEKEKYTTDFSLESSTYQFTQIEESNLLDPWDQLTSTGVKLSENATNNECLIQNGNGYRIRIDFPYLNNLLEIKEQGRIVKANLILRPVMDYMKYSELPSTIYINEIDKINSIGDYLYNSSGETLTPTLIKDYLYNKNTYYSFDITSYLNERIEETIIDPDQGLAISFTDSNAGTQLDYMVMGGYYNPNYKSELRIYYYYYDIQE